MPNCATELNPTATLVAIAADPGLRELLGQILKDFCHESRNQLNSLKLSIFLAQRQAPDEIKSTWRALESEYQTLETQFERVQTICRPMTLSRVAIALDLLFNDRRDRWSQTLASSGQTLVLVPPAGPNIARFDVDKLGTALDSLVAWRAEQGGPGTITVVCWGVDCDQNQITWSERNGLIECPVSQPPTSEVDWTLPVLTRVITEHRGTVAIEPSNGWSMVLTWPNQAD